jgi:hypothetical protein
LASGSTRSLTPANPHGHWENTSVWQEQERLLIRFGREWHSSPGPLPPCWLKWPDTTATVARLTAIATAEIERHGHWVVKDPRSSLLIPLWKAVAHQAGTRLRILRIFRADDEVAASLAARNGMPREFAMRIWADHQRSIDRDAIELESKTFRHDAIMREPLTAFAEIGEFRQRQALALLAALADGATANAYREQAVRMALRLAFPPVHSWENYAALFAAAPPDRLACDFTPAYATLGENDVANIVRMMPSIKVIFLLRDPVARAVSGGLHQLHWTGLERPALFAPDQPRSVLDGWSC